MLSLRPLAFLLIGTTSVLAQVPVQPPGVPVPGAVPPPAAGAPAANIAAANAAAAQAGIPLAERKIIEDINEPKLTGSALAGLYRQYTGRRVIVSAAAATAEFAFVQEASQQDPLTFAEAANLLRKAATIENFVFVPDASDPNLDILTLATGGIRPTNRGVAVYNENDPLPDGDAVISYVMTLSFIKPDEAVRTFTQIIGQFGAFGSIAAVPNASAVVITENTSLIRKLIDLKKEIDKPSSQVATRFITVKYADVTELATTLTELLTAQQSTQTTAGVQRAENNPAPVPGGAPQIPGQPGGSGSAETTPVQIIPDPRTNRIFAMGRPVDLLFVEGLVREFDTETSEKNFLRRKLRFLTVSDFLPIAGDALTRAFTGTGGGGAGGAAGGQNAQGGQNRGGQQQGQQQNNNRQGQQNNRGANTNANTGSSAFGGGAGGGGGSGTSAGSTSLGDPNVSSAPESVLVGRTLLVADNITNSIVVQGPPSGLEIVERLLDQIDVKPDQVMISTVIGQLTLTDNYSLGFDYIKTLNKGFAGAIGGGGFPGTIPLNGNTVFNPGTLGTGGLNFYGQIGNNLNVYIQALQQKTDFTVLSRPSIFTANNQKGIISSGERIAIPTSSNSFTNGGASTNIEYQDVVLKLEVIPLVNSENEITLQIALLNDEQNGTQTIAGGGSNGGNLTVPRITTREILTTVTVPNNETIVLGGLIIKRDNKDQTGIPILSDIPLLGKLFSSTTDNEDRSELMVFIQPSIVRSGQNLDAVQTDMDNRYDVSGRARTFADGSGSQVLPPLDPVLPVADKGSSRAVVIDPVPARSTKRSSLRPLHRP